MNASRIVIGLALCAAVLAGCGDDDDASGEVVLYTSMPQAVVDQLDGVIEQRFPDLEGNVWSFGSYDPWHD